MTGQPIPAYDPPNDYIDPMMLRIFQRQVAHQCDVGLAGAVSIKRGLRMRQESDPQGTGVVWIGVQMLLTGAGNAAKALWGPAGRRSAERAPLRQSLGVDDSSPLIEVDMRNNYEHFDERVERWHQESRTKNFADMLIGPREMVEGLDDIERFRWYDPDSQKLFFWGQEFDVAAIIDELERVLPIAAREGSKPAYR